MQLTNTSFDFTISWSLVHQTLRV